MDVEDYRERRQIALEQLATRMADKAIRTRSLLHSNQWLLMNEKLFIMHWRIAWISKPIQKALSQIVISH